MALNNLQSWKDLYLYDTDLPVCLVPFVEERLTTVYINGTKIPKTSKMFVNVFFLFVTHLLLFRCFNSHPLSTCLSYFFMNESDSVPLLVVKQYTTDNNQLICLVSLFSLDVLSYEGFSREVKQSTSVTCLGLLCHYILEQCTSTAKYYYE